MHPRRIVREEIVARLRQSADLTAAVRTIAAGRAWPWQRRSLPAVLVHVRDEEIERVATDAVERRMTAVVELIVEGGDGPDDMLDDLGELLEAAMREPAGAGEACIELRATRIDVGDRGETVVGVLTHEYSCVKVEER